MAHTGTVPAAFARKRLSRRPVHRGELRASGACSGVQTTWGTVPPKTAEFDKLLIPALALQMGYLAKVVFLNNQKKNNCKKEQGHNYDINYVLITNISASKHFSPCSVPRPSQSRNPSKCIGRTKERKNKLQPMSSAKFLNLKLRPCTHIVCRPQPSTTRVSQMHYDILTGL